MFLAARAGGHNLPELNGLPLEGALGGGVEPTNELVRIKDRAECGRPLLDSLERNVPEVMSHFSAYTVGFELANTDAAAGIDAKSRSIIHDLSTCISKHPDLNEKFLGLQKYRINGVVFAAEDAFARSSPSLDIHSSKQDF